MGLCPSCGRANRPDRVNCVYCGAQLRRAARSSPPSSRAAPLEPAWLSSPRPAARSPPPAPSVVPEISRPPRVASAPSTSPPPAAPPPPATAPAARPAWDYAGAPGPRAAPLPPPPPPNATPATGPPWDYGGPQGQGVGPPPPLAPPSGYSYAPPPEPPPRRKRGVLLAVVAVVVVVVVIAAAWATLARSSSHWTPAITGKPMLYSQAITPAHATQATEAGSPWTVYAVFGLGMSQSASGGGGLINGCSTVWENSSTFTLPATPSNATGGQVAGWIVLSGDAAGNMLMTFVNDLSGTIVASNAIVFSGSCTSTFKEFGAATTSPVDSSTVVASAGSHGGSNFLSGHSGATTILALLGPYWEVEYTTCSFLYPSGSGTQYVGIFYAGNGTLFDNVGVTSGAC